MKPRDPIARLPTHEVVNMPPHMGDQDLWADDPVLRHWCSVFGADQHEPHLARVGKLTGLEETFELANQANRHVPELRAFDRHGMRINAVDYGPQFCEQVIARAELPFYREMARITSEFVDFDYESIEKSLA